MLVHRFLIKDIALQAGLGVATVDRVLNRRGNVRQQTIDRVQQAIVALEEQRQQLAMTGRKILIDLVVEAPQTFLEALESACKEELPLMRPAVIRLRSNLRSRFPIGDLKKQLEQIMRRGSDGVILMSPEADRVKEMVNQLEAAKIPVVTLATDLEDTDRTAYVGLNNIRAGETAAWFVHKWLGDATKPTVLMTLRNDRFKGEKQRAEGFKVALEKYLPESQLQILTEGRDRPAFLNQLRDVTTDHGVDALYSIGGSNMSMLHTLKDQRLRPTVFIAHDLDPDNKALIEAGEIDLLLYHDLRDDMRNACRVILSKHFGTKPPAISADQAMRILVPPAIGFSGAILPVS